MRRPWSLGDLRTPSAPRLLAGCLAVVALLVVPPYGAASTAAAPAATTKMSDLRSHIQHIIFLMQENHAFDNLFGNYCQFTGSYCPDPVNGIPPRACVPINYNLPALGCIPPQNFSYKQLSLPTDLPHNWNTSHTAYHNGSMNGFIMADGFASTGHYNATEVPVEWDLAEEYGLADNFYSSALSYSLPNHWYEVAPKAPATSYKALIAQGTTPGYDDQYLDQSNQSSTIESTLLNSSVSWKYYDINLTNYRYDRAFNYYANASAYDYWNPLAARAQSYFAPAVQHFVNRSNFFSDAANGTLPDLSWIIPSHNTSDHPPYNITQGEDWISSVVDALEASPDWNSSVLFISWDEYGGFYDHVAPPSVDANGDGFRVPLLAIGPWVRQGVVDHKNMSFSSILRLMEERFHLPCLGPRDCNAALPLNLFDFSRSKPRPPIYIGIYGNISYPMPLQSSGKLPPYYGTYYPPPLPRTAPLTPAQIAGLDWS
jgi:phospholipase C